ncbi:unnamed protein product [Lampetra fluviatilis]
MSLSNQSPQRDIGKVKWRLLDPKHHITIGARDDELTRAPSTACCWSDAMEDPSEIKRRIVRALCHSARALREEQAAWAEGPVDGEDARGLALCSALEAALVHGLRPHLLRAEQAWLPLWRWWAPGLPAAPLPNPHFWPVLGAVTHSNVMEQLTSLKFVRTDVGRCRAWLRVALNDGLLACYVDSLLCDAAALADWYERGALLLDAEQSPALLAALQGLDSVRFQLSYRSAALDQWTPGPLALAGLCPAEESPRETAHAEPSVALGSTDGKDGDAGGRRPPVGSPEAERVTERDRGADSTSAADGVEAEPGSDQGREASSGEPPVTAEERRAPDAAVELPSSAAREADGREQKVSGKEAKASSSEPPVSVIERALPGGDHHNGTLDGAHSGAELEIPSPPPTEPQQGTANPQATRGCGETIGPSDVTDHRERGAEDPFGGVRKMGLLLKRRRMKTWKEYFCELTASELRLYLPDGRAADNPAPPPSPVDPAAPAGEAARPFDGAPGERPGHGAVAVSLNDGYVLHKAYSLRLCQSVALLGLAKLSVYAAPADCLELSFAGHKLFFQAGSADDAEDWVERLREVLHEMGHRAVDE